MTPHPHPRRRPRQHGPQPRPRLPPDPAFEIVGLVNRSTPDLPPELRALPVTTDFHEALARLKPDLVSIATYSDSHADYAVAAMEAGAHVFVEKPLATTAADAERVAAKARETGRKVVVGYILRHHPSWQRLIAEARALGGPYVFRLNLNQQSSGPTWEVHKALMRTTSPIVDCGVHYVDVMCQITDAAPVEVRGMGLRLSAEIARGHVQLRPLPGALRRRLARLVRGRLGPDDVRHRLLREGRGLPERRRLDPHARERPLRRHRHPHQDLARSACTGSASPTRTSAWPTSPATRTLCDREAAFVARAIAEDLDLTRHLAGRRRLARASASPRTRASAPATPSSSEDTPWATSP